MTRRCPDCQVSPGQPHEEGCDVARDRTEDLNELAMMGYRGELVWDRRTERWVRP